MWLAGQRTGHHPKKIKDKVSSKKNGVESEKESKIVLVIVWKFHCFWNKKQKKKCKNVLLF